MNRTRLLIAIAASAAVPAGCGNDSMDSPEQASVQPAETAQEPAATQPAAEPQPAARPRGPLVKLRDSQFGPVIFNGHDQAAYLFTRDNGGKSRCYGECAVAWPPFHARGKPRAGRGIKRSLLGTVRRRSGRRQVTYAGQPLYFYEHDPKGEVLCNDIAEFGGTWFAVTADGKPPA
jgi:predicted lipoprotein with Yx(FWY)xxD motif